MRKLTLLVAVYLFANTSLASQFGFICNNSRTQFILRCNYDSSIEDLIIISDKMKKVLTAEKIDEIAPGIRRQYCRYGNDDILNINAAIIYIKEGSPEKYFNLHLESERLGNQILIDISESRVYSKNEATLLFQVNDCQLIN